MRQTDPSKVLLSEVAPLPAPGGITLRSGIVALAALALVAYLMPVWLVRMKGPEMPGVYLPLIPFTAVLLLVALRHAPRPLYLRFSAGEVLSVFCILAVGLGAFQAVGELIALLPTPYYYATPENGYREHFLTEIPAFLVPFDPKDEGAISEPILRFYRGSPHGVPWEVWLGPLTWWLGLLVMIFSAQFCLGALLRRQWLEHERLMFPHVTMVTSLVEERGGDRPPVLRDRLFWAGAGVSGFIFLLEGLNHYFPAVPKPGLASLSMRDFLVDEPWSSMRPELAIQPYLVAIAYLLTTEITFSVWFFAVLDNLFQAAATSLALTPSIRGAWVSNINTGADTVGAVVVFLGALVWTGRRHFKGVLRRAFGRGADDPTEVMSHRTAFWGFWASAAGVLAWCAAAGVPLWFAALVFGVYGLVVLFVARLVAEIGLLTAWSGWLLPQMVAIQFCGYRGGEAGAAAAVGAAKPPLLKGLSVLSFVWPTVMLGPHLMSLILTGFQATEGTAQRRRWTLRLSFVGLLLAVGIFAWRMLAETYARGALNSELGWYRESIWVFNNVLIRDIFLRERSWVTDWTHVGFMGVGGAVMAFLLSMRRAFYWWPIHPIGYITTGIHRGLWFSIFIGWFIKRTVLKYGGGDAFKHLIGFFIGLFAGQFGMAALWYLVGLIAGEVGFGIL
ncbi:MAG: hypothetical protein A3F84_03075 [Candidatus Handelsmanbacteria bacterium RIFCSPLOWO2_12_FULL_64_10]|uniref:Uncharacterized protein n=1 Tax=Handelsmanbacteria sp. (strain RIFCSPLOWO2_12_FULL_64_10) TaxID=1817868 RepID=A0A1F6CFZ6_HANXR|nr:MAG: hypothetical protein A3F84_03075 [Candidatus Handelsmanbacteria bacterium RIFCSPLOWO2_12_FULL_64_10]